MEHPYLYGEWVEDAIGDLFTLREYTNVVMARLERGLAVPQGMLRRMSELSDKLERQFDPEMEKYNGQA